MRSLVIGLLPVLLLAGCEKYALDRQMEELCKKDGGVTVFETVTLPASRFGEHGEILPVMPVKTAKNLGELLFGNEYFMTNEITTLKSGKTHDQIYSQGRLDRTLQKVVRKSDGKVLGESVWYSRIGGELTPFGMPSSASCPHSRENLIGRVFLKGE